MDEDSAGIGIRFSYPLIRAAFSLFPEISTRMISLPIWQMRSHGITKSSPWQKKAAEFHRTRKNESGKMSRFWIEFHINRTAERFAGTDIDNFFLAEIYNAHAVLLFTDSYGKTYAKMLLQLT